ncbi:MAG: endonuclease/exonuclease/phosphatase family protein [Nocardioidaceae bacterium]
MTLTVMTYNIHQGGRGGRLLDDVVRAVAPDVLVVNECPKAPLLWRGRCRSLAERWGLRVAAGGRNAGSNLLLVGPRVEVRRAGAQVLPQPLLSPRRGVAWAQLRVESRLVGVVAVHLGLDAERREDEVVAAIATARGLRGPVVLAGDLNERPDGPSWRRLARAGYADHGGADGPTFPADQPRKRIDALLVRGEARVLRHGAPDLPERLLATASDHRPLVAELDLTGPAA